MSRALDLPCPGIEESYPDEVFGSLDLF